MVLDSVIIFLQLISGIVTSLSLSLVFFEAKESGQITILEQDPPNPKIDGGLSLYPPSSTSKDVVFIANSPPPPLYPAVKNDSEIQTSLFLLI